MIKAKSIIINIFVIVLFLANIFIDNIKFIGTVFILELFLNIIFNKNLWENIKKLKILMYIYICTFFIQILSSQEGEILFKILGIYITKQATLNFILCFIRIINLIMFSWLFSKKCSMFNQFTPRDKAYFFERYRLVFENVVALVPEVFILFRRRMGLKAFFKHILKKIKI